jgi:uncharacterized protein with GYD domain
MWYASADIFGWNNRRQSGCISTRPSQEDQMVAYITLYKYTQQGAATIKDSPKRIQAVKAMTEKLGGRVIGVWLTMGQYDLVDIAEFPNDEAAARMALEVGRLGNVTSQTLRAFSEDEFASLVSQMS